MNAVKVRKKGGLLVLQETKFPSRNPENYDFRIRVRYTVYEFSH